jgi:hypothetical protein
LTQILGRDTLRNNIVKKLMNFNKTSAYFFLIFFQSVWVNGGIIKLSEVNYSPESNATLCMENSMDLNNTKTPVQCSCETTHFSTEVKICDICCFKEENSKLQCKAVCTADVPMLTRDMYEKDLKRIIESFSMQQKNSSNMEKEKLLVSPSDQTLPKTIIRTNQGRTRNLKKLYV